MEFRFFFSLHGLRALKVVCFFCFFFASLENYGICFITAWLGAYCMGLGLLYFIYFHTLAEAVSTEEFGIIIAFFHTIPNTHKYRTTIH